jgi:hypothetical protein
VSLGTVRVVDRSSCAAIGDSTAAVYLVWEQVRTALAAAELTAGVRAMSSTTVTYERTVDPATDAIRRHAARLRVESVRQPWRSLSADSLRRVGYVIPQFDGTVYHAPGLDVLLSDVFLNDHCFTLSARSDASLIGVDFEPAAERRRVPEIRGTVWLDRASSELRRMEFRYANIPSVQAAHAGGGMEFARLTNGLWVIAGWHIRMPVLLRPPAGRPGRVLGVQPPPDIRVAEVRVAGGDVTMIRRGQDTLWRRPPLTLIATIQDSASGAPVADARAALTGSRREARSDARGRFAIEGIVPGAYTLEIRTPSLDSILVVHRAQVTLIDSLTPIGLRVPSAAQARSALCAAPSAAAGAADGMVVGRVVARDSTPGGGVRVRVEWDTASVATMRGTDPATAPAHREARTDSTGVFRLCGVPDGVALTLRADLGIGAAMTLPVRIPPGQRFVRADLVIQ